MLTGTVSQKGFQEMATMTTSTFRLYPPSLAAP